MNGITNGVFLLRSQFLHQELDGEAAQIAALLWQHWFEAARFAHPGAASAQLEARVWGAPRAELPALCEALRAHLSSEGETPHVRLRDADTIEISIGPRAAMAIAREQPYSSARLWRQMWHRREENWLAAEMKRWVEVLGASEAMHGLCLMLRCSIQSDAHARSQGAMQGTLVLFGRVTRRGFSVAGVWPGGSTSGMGEETFHSTPWPQEADWAREVRRLQHDSRALDANAESAQDAPIPSAQEEEGAPAAWGEQVFGMSRPNSLVSAIMFFVAFPWHLGPFFLRLVISVALVCAAGTMWQAPALKLFGGLLGLYGMWALQHLVRSALFRVTSVRGMMKGAFEKMYTQPMRFLPVEAEDGEEPSLQKFSRDIEALGGRAIADLRMEPAPPGRTFTRSFLMGDGATIFTLLLQSDNGQLRNVPALPNFLLSTYFVDNSRFISTSGPAGYTDRTPLPVQAVALRDVAGADEMWARHNNNLRHFGNGRALENLTQGTEPRDWAPELCRRLSHEHDEACPHIAARGFYTLSDAIHFAFDWVRPFAREPEAK